MTDELAIAIKELYTTFFVYPLNPVMQGCPCCVSESDKETLHAKQLRDLQESDLSKYARKAMTTWGDTNDFKHFLPRIFELLATTDFVVDGFVVLGNLEYGKWDSWALNEQLAVKNFLFAWWSDLVKNTHYFDIGIFIEIYMLLGNIDELLNRWVIKLGDNSFRNFVEFIYYDYNDLNSKKANFRALDNLSIEKILQWANNHINVLEKGFFHFEQSDKEFSERISIALFMLEKANDKAF